jgi:hypothetical protein
MENTAMVAKTLLKDVARGCTLMLDPDIMDFLENVKQTPHGIVNLEHPYKNPWVVCDATCRPHYWSHAINDFCRRLCGHSYLDMESSHHVPSSGNLRLRR